MPNSIYIATSLDGYIARKDGSIDWLMSIPNPENSDFGFHDFMNTIDAIVMGRNTFEQVVSFGEWPYTRKVFVFSSTLKRLPDDLAAKAEIINGEIPEIVTDLNTRGFRNLYIDGGKTIQSFLKEDLIDEMIITRVAVLLGTGIPLFRPLENTSEFEVIETEKLNDYLVKSHYRRVRR